MQEIEDVEKIKKFLSENENNFFITIQGTLKEDNQSVIVNFYDTDISKIEPALGFAMSANNLLLKGFLGGILMEFEHYNKLENGKI